MRSSNSDVRNSSNKRLNPSERVSLLDAHNSPNVVQESYEEADPTLTSKKFLGI